jgi:hypothetical protein
MQLDTAEKPAQKKSQRSNAGLHDPVLWTQLTCLELEHRDIDLPGTPGSSELKGFSPSLGYLSRSDEAACQRPIKGNVGSPRLCWASVEPPEAPP